MRVLIVSAFPPDPAPEANHALHISEHLAEAGVTVHVLCKRGSVGGNRTGIVVHPVMEDWTWSDLPRLVKCLRESRPDVVLLLYLGWIYKHEQMITFLPTICRKILPNVPCVTQFENVDSALPPRSAAARALRKATALGVGGRDVHVLFGTLLRDSARIIALSNPHKAHLIRHWPAVEDKCVVVPPPPLMRVCREDPALARSRVRADLRLDADAFLLVYWGYIYPGKGVETLLRAFRISCRRDPDMRLILVGGRLDFSTARTGAAEYFQMVRDLPQRLGIADRVRWTGHFGWDSDEGSRYLYAGDLCVLPLDGGVTLNNSSLAAASTHGLPVIGTELSVGRDEGLEHGRNIYLCRPRDPDMLAEAIQQVRHSPDLYQRLRTGIGELASTWHHWDSATKRLVGVLEWAISDHAGSRARWSRRVANGRTGAAAGHHDPAGRCDAGVDGSGGGPAERPRGLSPAGFEEVSVASVECGRDDVDPPPLVSVIVAAHNVAKYLTQCLDSLVNQSLQGIEILVINDASTDDTFAIAKEFQSRYRNVRVIDCKRNLGLASVRNLGMRLARGTYIGFVDGDDWADTRKYAWMYRRAVEEDADIVFAAIRPFVDDTKDFIRGNDWRVWAAISPEVKQTVFRACDEPRVFVMEPAVWAKLYKRSFLEAHALAFEEGMNSVEDVIFHFAALWKAERIVLLEKPLSFYRLNRPGQITGRKDRRLFETFTVFDKAATQLAAWNVPESVWAGLLRTEQRFFQWMLGERVASHLRSEFFAACAEQLRKIPERAFRVFAREAGARELARLLYMRSNRRRAYDRLATDRGAVLLGYAMFRYQRHRLLARGLERFGGQVRRRLGSVSRSLTKRALTAAGVGAAVRDVRDGLGRVRTLERVGSAVEESLIEVRRIDDQKLFLADRYDRAALAHAVWRMVNDHYLLQTVAFRSGDCVIDVGAHVGVVSIYLAKKYPFIKVYAVEPDPLNYALLQQNIELNGLSNVTAVNRAVAGSERWAQLYTKANYSGWASIDAAVAASHRLLRAARVQTVTLDRLFEEHDIANCRALKITAPGAVLETLEGLTGVNRVDLVCGEVDLTECSRAKLELESRRVARQIFWRTVDRRDGRTVYDWVHHMPTGIQRSDRRSSPRSALPAQFGQRLGGSGDANGELGTSRATVPGHHPGGTD